MAYRAALAVRVEGGAEDAKSVLTRILIVVSALINDPKQCEKGENVIRVKRILWCRRYETSVVFRGLFSRSS